MTPAEVAAALAATKMQDRIALAFAGNEPDRLDEHDEWWTTPRSLAEQAMEAVLADPLWRGGREAQRVMSDDPTTEAGRLLLGLDMGPQEAYWTNLGAGKMRAAICAIEAEARATPGTPATRQAAYDAILPKEPDDTLYAMADRIHDAITLRAALADLDAAVKELP